MESWDMTWPVGLLVIVVAVAIIEAVHRALSSSKELVVLPNDRSGSAVTPSTSINVTEDRRGDGD